MSRRERHSILTFMQTYGSEATCRKTLAAVRWADGFLCPKCGAQHGYALRKGDVQCASCRHQVSVTAGTVMHGSHLPLRKWFLAFYLVMHDKRGISAVQLFKTLNVTYKTAWFVLARIRTAMGQRDKMYLLSGVVEFDDAYFGGASTGGKRGRGTEKAKVFVAVSLDEKGRPMFVRMQVTKNLKQASVKKFAKAHIQVGSTIHADAFRSYPPALSGDYELVARPYNPKEAQLHWLHVLISNAKVFILGTYHGLPSKYLQSYLDEFSFRFSRRHFHGKLVDSLLAAVLMPRPGSTKLADAKG